MLADMPIEAPASSQEEALVKRFMAADPKAISGIAFLGAADFTENWWIQFTTDATSLDVAEPPLQTRPLLEEFIAAHRLDLALHGVRQAAVREFGSSIDVKQSLLSDPDLGGDAVRVDIRVSGLTRQQFRERRAAFDSAVEDLATSDLERVVVVVSRA